MAAHSTKAGTNIPWLRSRFCPKCFLRRVSRILVPLNKSDMLRCSKLPRYRRGSNACYSSTRFCSSSQGDCRIVSSHRRESCEQSKREAIGLIRTEIFFRAFKMRRITLVKTQSSCVSLGVVCWGFWLQRIACRNIWRPQQQHTSQPYYQETNSIAHMQVRW